MKNNILKIVCVAITTVAISSCGFFSGAGGANTGIGVNSVISSNSKYILVPSGDIITYTIDISTPDGMQKLHKISVKKAKKLAETEACRKYNCNRLIDPRFDYFKKGRHILRITVDGQPGKYELKRENTTPIPQIDKAPININITQ